MAESGHFFLVSSFPFSFVFFPLFSSITSCSTILFCSSLSGIFFLSPASVSVLFRIGYVYHVTTPGFLESQLKCDKKMKVTQSNIRNFSSIPRAWDALTYPSWGAMLTANPEDRLISQVLYCTNQEHCKRVIFRRIIFRPTRSSCRLCRGWQQQHSQAPFFSCRPCLFPPPPPPPPPCFFFFFH